MGARVSATTVGTVRLPFVNNKYLLLNNIYFISDFKRNLILVSKLHEQFASISFDINPVTIYKNGMTICSGYVDNGIYFIQPIFNNLLQIEMFNVAKPSSKRQKRFLMMIMTHICGI